MYKRILTSVFSFIVFISVPQICLAVEFEMNEKYQIKLGAGWDPIYPDLNKVAGKCYNTESGFSTATNKPALQSTNTYAEFLESISKFESVTKEKYRLDASANYAGLSGNASFSRSTSKSFFTDDKIVTWALTLERTYTPEFITDFDLSTRGSKRLEDAQSSNQYGLFFGQCGRSLVTRVVRGSSIAIVYSIQASSTTKVSAIKSAISGSVSYGGVGQVSGSQNFSQAIKNADSKSRITVKVYQTGAAIDTPAIELIALQKPGDLTAIRTALQPALQQMKYDSSSIVRFTSEPIANRIGLPPSTDRLSEFTFVSNRLKEIDELRKKVVTRIAILDALRNRSNSGDILLLSGAIDQITQEKSALQAQLINIDQYAINCRDSTTVAACPVVDDTFLSGGVTQFVQRRFIELAGWSKKEKKGLFGSVKTYSVQGVKFVPSFKVFNAPVIRKITLFRNDIPHGKLEGDQVKLFADGDAKLAKSITQTVNVRCPEHNHSDGYKKSCSWLWHKRQKKFRNGLIVAEKKVRYHVEVVDFDGNVERVDIASVS